MDAYAWQTLAFLLTQFVCRHWLIGLENGLATLGLGLGIVALLRWSGLFKPATAHSLEYAVSVVALYKTAFYFVLGDSSRARPPYRLVIGLQLPGPQNLLPSGSAGPFSIWHPTALARLLPEALCCYALARLLARAWQVTAARRSIARLAVDADGTGAGAPGGLLRESIRAAAAAIGRKRLGSIRVSVIRAGLGPTPFVLGVIRPCIVIDDQVLERLRAEGGGCLESAMRHELAHIARGDHISRWAQAWLADVAAVTLLGSFLSAQATRCEERVCDSLALRSVADAPALFRAILIATESRPEAPPVASSPGARGVRQLGVAAPYFETNLGLLGVIGHRRAERDALVARLEAISRQAGAMRRAAQTAERRLRMPLIATAARAAFLMVRIAIAGVLFLMLAVVFYFKIYLLPSL